MNFRRNIYIKRKTFLWNKYKCIFALKRNIASQNGKDDYLSKANVIGKRENKEKNGSRFVNKN